MAATVAALSSAASLRWSGSTASCSSSSVGVRLAFGNSFCGVGRLSQLRFVSSCTSVKAISSSSPVGARASVGEAESSEDVSGFTIHKMSRDYLFDKRNIRDQQRRVLVDKFAAKRAELKAAINSLELSADERYAAAQKLQSLPRNSCKTRIRNRCFKTGRSRGVYRDVGIARMAFREKAHRGELPGMTKSSW